MRISISFCIYIKRTLYSFSIIIVLTAFLNPDFTILPKSYNLYSRNSFRSFIDWNRTVYLTLQKWNSFFLLSELSLPICRIRCSFFAWGTLSIISFFCLFLSDILFLFLFFLFCSSVSKRYISIFPIHKISIKNKTIPFLFLTARHFTYSYDLVSLRIFYLKQCFFFYYV